MIKKVRAIENKRLSELTLDDIVYVHIGGRDPEWTSDFFLISTLEAAQENMRHSNSFEKSRVYAPAFCAFAILDQLGSCYADAEKEEGSKRNGVQRALHQFCDISDNSTISEHLYMFRNGLVHDASFTSWSDDRNGGRKHYMFRYSPLTEIVQLPKYPWDGTAAGIEGSTTLVDPQRLIGIASDAVRRVQDLFFEQRDRLQVLQPRDEVLHKYLLWKPRQKRN